LIILSGASNFLFPAIHKVPFLWIIFAPSDLQALRVARVSLARSIFVIIDCLSVSEPIAIAL
jgi:hypothetical protein